MRLKPAATSKSELVDSHILRNVPLILAHQTEWIDQMKFEAESASVHKLLAQLTESFYVPIFQRGYSWGEADIRHLFQTVFNGMDSQLGGGDTTPFLGACILVDSKSGIGAGQIASGKVCQIIDGQQRITTLLIIACELGFHLEELGEKLSDGPLKEFVRGRVILLRKFLTVLETDDDRLHRNPVMIRSGDRWGWGVEDCNLRSPVAKYLGVRGIKREAFTAEDEALANAISAVSDCLREIARSGWPFSRVNELDWGDPRSHRILFQSDEEAEAVSGEVGTASAPLLRLLAFARHFIFEVRVIKTTTEDLSGALALFGPLNSTGQSLTAIELLKPRYVADLGDRYEESTEKAAFDDIQAFVEDPDPSKRMRNTEGIVTHIALAESGHKLGADLNEQRDFLERRYVDLGDRQERCNLVEGARELVAFVRDEWESSRVPGRFSGNSLAALAFKVLSPKHTIVVPVLARYWKLQDGDACEAAMAIAAFSTLWRLAKGGAGGIDSEYRRLLLKGVPEVGLSPISRRPSTSVPPEDLPPSVSDFRAGLLHLLGEGCGSTRKEWVDLATNQNAYRGSRWFTRFALLAAFHDSIRDTTAGQEGQLKPGTEGCGRTLTVDNWEMLDTVEHIAPQKRGSDGYEEEIYGHSLHHTIGNLALLPLSLNVDAGNRSWQEKHSLFVALGETDRDARETALSSGGLSLSQAQKDRLTHASHIPGVSVLRDQGGAEYSADFVRHRGRRLCELIYDRLVSWL
jgi:hypothetical protein